MNQRTLIGGGFLSNIGRTSKELSRGPWRKYGNERRYLPAGLAI